MHLRVFHRTRYRYSAPVAYSIQTLRLTPVPYGGLTVLDWRIEANGRSALPSVVGGLGNILHCHSIVGPHCETSITAEGAVDTHRGDGIVIGAPEPLLPVFFLRITPLTAADAAIIELARQAIAGKDILEGLHQLMHSVRAHLSYQPRHTNVETSAAAALQRGHGVCQDHAHLLIAAARAIGIPARYASGYLWTGSEMQDHDASHAWAEAFVDGLGWIGFDASSGICPDETYIRVSIGLDYWAAAPVRGIRRGAVEEEMRVKVQVQRASADQ